MSESLFVIDVFGLVFQVFHAIPAMTSPAGQPTNAVFGFTRDILTILKTKQPTYLVCAMDSPGKGVRDDIYSEYKAHREEMPEELRPQIAVVKQVIEAFGIPAIGQEGWEADDVLATLAKQGRERGLEVVLVTNDKDARQLLTPTTRMYNVRKDSYFDADALLADWGVRPDQVVDFQSLVGDAVDNVPGVPQIGPKTATNLLQQFGTLDEVLKRSDEVTAKKVRENLKTFADQALLSRQLVRLRDDLLLDFHWNSARAGQLDVVRLAELFRECGFRRFIDEIKTFSPTPIDVPSLFADGEPAITVIRNLPEFDQWLAQQAEHRRIAVRVETTGLDALSSQVVALTLATNDRSAAFVSLSPLAGETPLPAHEIVGRLLKHLQRSDSRLVGHDLKPLANSLLSAANDPTLTEVPLDLDSMVGSYLLEAGSRSHHFPGLVERYCDAPLEPLSRGWSADDGSIKSVNPKQLQQAVAEETCLTLRVADKLRTELTQQELWPLYEQLERPLISVLAEMERIGVKVDADELAQQNAEVTERINELMAEIHAQAGEEFNIDSPKQLRVILFEKLELPVIKKTKTGPSTDQDVLEKLSLTHRLPALIIEHRQLVKLKGTYLDALPLMINSQTGRIHASFNQVVAATGRLSSSNPNLQNIPVRTAEGERVRRAFVPGVPGWKLVCADYSQIELRMLAHFSGDEALRLAFSAGIDVHAAVASEVFGVPTENVTSEQRRIAKAVNFGVIYGQSPFGLSEALGISREEATAFINSYFEKYAGVAAFINHTLDETARTGFAKTILGRRRAISGIRAERTGQLSMPERTAVNTVIQGSAADLIKQAMINVSSRLKREQHPAKLLLQIHDELMFETPPEAIDSLSALVREEMESALDVSVPIKIDLGVGDNWLVAKS